MSRQKRNYANMFNDFTRLSFDVRNLGGIVQNDAPVSSEELQEWSDRVNNAINQLNSLREDVIRYYQD